MTNEYYRFASKSIPPSCLRTTDIANIVSVSRGLLHGRNREFEAATTILLQSLFDLYPERVILIDDWGGELASDAKGELVPLSDCLYRIHGPTVTPDMRRMLGDGGWVMTCRPSHGKGRIGLIQPCFRPPSAPIQSAALSPHGSTTPIG
jgi:hypothetical protein